MKYLKSLFTGSFLFASLSLFAAQPYDSVHLLPQTPYHVTDGYIFYTLINTRNAAVIVDVDSEDGGVARYIAQQAASLPSLSAIYSISDWLSPDPSQRHLFQSFLSNVIQENSDNLITSIRMSSLEAASALNINADFISIVGGNSEEGVYHDILSWYPHLSNIGVICGNNWNEISVQLGVVRAAAALNINLKISGNVWYFDKTAP